MIITICAGHILMLIGSFLEEFTEGKPWAHLDIAGTAWDTGREYWGKGPTGFGVHLLVALARRLGK